MLISLSPILSKYNIHPTGVIEVGAHYCEEYDEFKSCGINDMLLIEPCQAAFDIMVNRINDPNVIFVKCACGFNEGLVEMNTSPDNQGQSNSILKPNLHLQQHPEVRFTNKETISVMKLDNIKFHREKYQMLAMDCQGFEGEIIKGAHYTLPYIDIIYSEVNNGETYTDNMLVGEMDSILGIYGFIRVETFWPSPNWTWGDAIWVKSKFLA